jgi:hypothetical protein
MAQNESSESGISTVVKSVQCVNETSDFHRILILQMVMQVESKRIVQCWKGGNINSACDF